LELPGFKRG